MAGQGRHDADDLALHPGLVLSRHRPAGLQQAVLDQTARVNYRSVLNHGLHEDVDGRVDVSGGRANEGHDALVGRSLEVVQTFPMSR